MLEDVKVRWLSSDTIERFALEWRKVEGNENSPSFRILDFLKNRLPHLLSGKAMEIVDHDDLGDDGPAFVQFSLNRENGYQRAELHAESWVLENARFDDEEARLILAHEMGHLILHDTSAQKFSPGPDKNLRFLENEESGEWQAKRFADAFLVPLHVAASFSSSDELSNYCNVDIDCAKRRLRAVRAAALENGRSSGNSCTNCGNYSLKSYGMSHFCLVCAKHSVYI